MGLTNQAIDDAKATDCESYLWDDELHGFGLMVYPTGFKEYVIWQAPRMVRFGAATEISLTDARAFAEAYLKRLKVVRVDDRERSKDFVLAPDVAEGVQRFVNRYDLSSNKRGRLYTYIVPVLGEAKIADVSAQDIEELIWRVPLPSNRIRMFSLVRSLFRSFEQWGWRETDSNPCHEIDRSKFRAPTMSDQHERRRLEEEERRREQLRSTYRLEKGPPFLI